MVKRIILAVYILIFSLSIFAHPTIRIVKSLDGMEYARDYVWLNDEELLYFKFGPIEDDLKYVNVQNNLVKTVFSKGFSNITRYNVSNYSRLHFDTDFLSISVLKRDQRAYQPYIMNKHTFELIEWPNREYLTAIDHTQYSKEYAMAGVENGLLFGSYDILTDTYHRTTIPWGSTRVEGVEDWFDTYDGQTKYDITSIDGNELLVAFSDYGGRMTTYITRLTGDGIEPLKPLRMNGNIPDYGMNYQSFFLEDGTVLIGKGDVKNVIRDPDEGYVPLSISDREGNILYTFEDFLYRYTSDAKIHLSPNRRYIVINGYDIRKRPYIPKNYLLEIVYD